MAALGSWGFLFKTKTMNENIIILYDGENYEAWGSLVEICKTKNLSYNYLKRMKFPFEYKGMSFIKVPFRKSNGIEGLEPKK